MQKSKFRTAYNSVTGNPRYEDVDPVSMTIQDDSYTIQELLQRSAQGMNALHQSTTYIDVTDLNQISQYFRYPGSLDLTEVGEFYDEVSRLKKRIEKAKKLKEKKEDEESKDLKKETSLPNPVPKGPDQQSSDNLPDGVIPPGSSDK